MAKGKQEQELLKLQAALEALAASARSGEFASVRTEGAIGEAMESLQMLALLSGLDGESLFEDQDRAGEQLDAMLQAIVGAAEDVGGNQREEEHEVRGQDPEGAGDMRERQKAEASEVPGNQREGEREVSEDINGGNFEAENLKGAGEKSMRKAGGRGEEGKQQATALDAMALLKARLEENPEQLRALVSQLPRDLRRKLGQQAPDAVVAALQGQLRDFAASVRRLIGQRKLSLEELVILLEKEMKEGLPWQQEEEPLEERIKAEVKAELEESLSERRKGKKMIDFTFDDLWDEGQEELKSGR